MVGDEGLDNEHGDGNVRVEEAHARQSRECVHPVWKPDHTFSTQLYQIKAVQHTRVSDQNSHFPYILLVFTTWKTGRQGGAGRQCYHTCMKTRQCYIYLYENQTMLYIQLSILRRLAKIHSESDLLKATPHIKPHFQFSSVQLYIPV